MLWVSLIYNYCFFIFFSKRCRIFRSKATAIADSIFLKERDFYNMANFNLASDSNNNHAISSCPLMHSISDISKLVVPFYRQIQPLHYHQFLEQRQLCNDLELSSKDYAKWAIDANLQSAFIYDKHIDVQIANLSRKDQVLIPGLRESDAYISKADTFLPSQQLQQQEPVAHNIAVTGLQHDEYLVDDIEDFDDDDD
jgi:hypothetical protein